VTYRTGSSLDHNKNKKLSGKETTVIHENYFYFMTVYKNIYFIIIIFTFDIHKHCKAILSLLVLAI